MTKLLQYLIHAAKPNVLNIVNNYVISLSCISLEINKKKTDGVQPSIPKILLPFKSKCIGEALNYPLIRLIVSCTYVSRFIRLEPSPSFDSITKGPGYSGTPFVMESDVREFLQKVLGVNPRHFGKVPKSLLFKDFHMTSKVGPTGLHALWSSYLDCVNIPSELRESISILSGPRLPSLMTNLASLYSQIPSFFKTYGSQESSVIRKLSIIKDKEGKTREVAILDYYSQSSLKPLHSFLFRNLKKINQDCTHDQHKLIKKLRPTLGSKFHSIDLTTATDRFPIAIEKLILSVWFGKQYAEDRKSVV